MDNDRGDIVSVGPTFYQPFSRHCQDQMDWSAAGDTQTNHPDPNQRTICVRFLSDMGSITQPTVKLG